MYVLVIIDTLFAVSHHLFYIHLNGKEAINQPMMLRYNTAIAFFAKASLSTAATTAFHQRVWRVVRYKTARVETINSIFTANTDFSSFLTWNSIRKVKIGTLLALYCWTTPRIVILTSETLSFLVGVFEETTTCQSVRTLNFKKEEKVDWRDPQKIDDQFLSSLSLWNSTLDPSESPSDPDAEGFDYYHSSSKQFGMLTATKTALMGEPIVRKESAIEICGQGWNCSYIVNVVTSGYKCQELASGVNSEAKKLGNGTAPFNTSAIAAMGNRTYLVINDRGEYGDPQMPIMPSQAGGRLKEDTPYLEL
ncbi:hypothetical protein FNAPI_11046 [Fusarium napiforme]|uniref:Uncharacterized protein n=1 Tax=Fusarium napiforme TaxID=42672 RepID=A0A8H5MSK9_9HYPO|nr:hypothetical protein FNAPI_11046 [Fusarium napiforme]